jgi:hypothetical protein
MIISNEMSTYRTWITTWTLWANYCCELISRAMCQ